MQIPTTSGGRTAGYRIGGDQSAGIPASPDGSAPSYVVAGAAVEPHAGTVLAGDDAAVTVIFALCVTYVTDGPTAGGLLIDKQGSCSIAKAEVSQFWAYHVLVTQSLGCR